MHPQPGPIEQLSHQAAGALHHGENRLDLLAGQHHRYAMPVLHPFQAGHVPQGLGENLVVQEHDGVQGLGLRG